MAVGEMMEGKKSTDRILAMKIKSVTLENYRCFRQLGPVELGENVTLLIGNNGGGKTTLLDAVRKGLGAIATHLPEVSGVGLEKTDLRQEHRKPAPFCRVALETRANTTWDRTLRRDKSKTTGKQVPPALGLKALSAFLDETVIDKINAGESTRLPLFAYYGVSRAILDIPLTRKGFKQESNRYDALAGALEEGNRFKKAFIWFYNKENEENRLQKEKQSFQVTLKELDVVRNAIRAMFPDLENPRIEVNPLRFVVDKGGEPLRLEQLSDGYQTMFGLVLDLASRFAMANPEMANPLEAEAVVMVDEIDLHLHPEWQRRIIGDLLRTFPNAQFLLTTHSPYMVESLNNHLMRDQVEGLEIPEEEIRGILPLPASGIRAYLAEEGKLTDILDEKYGLIDDKLLPHFNKINALYDKMGQLQWDARA